MSLRVRILIFLVVVLLSAAAPHEWSPWPLVIAVAAYVVFVLPKINR